MTPKPAIEPGRRYRFSGVVQIFEVEKPWVYVPVPKRYTTLTRDLADRGLVAVTASVGTSQWNTSLLPKGDGTHFLALPAKVRKSETIAVGDKVRVSFVIRDRRR